MNTSCPKNKDKKVNHFSGGSLRNKRKEQTDRLSFRKCQKCNKKSEIGDK